MTGRKFDTECGGPTNIGRWDADADNAALVPVVERYLRVMADSIESVFTERNVKLDLIIIQDLHLDAALPIIRGNLERFHCIL